MHTVTFLWISRRTKNPSILFTDKELNGSLKASAQMSLSSLLNFRPSKRPSSYQLAQHQNKKCFGDYWEVISFLYSYFWSLRNLEYYSRDARKTCPSVKPKASSISRSKRDLQKLKALPVALLFPFRSFFPSLFFSLSLSSPCLLRQIAHR